MGTEESRKVVLKYHEHLRDRQIPEALALLKDDVDWWIVGKPHHYPPGGTKTKEEVADILGFLDANLKNWFEMKLQNVIAENDRVAVEWESHAITKAGRIYANTFSFIFVVKVGKIVQVREYCDLRHVAEVLITSDNPITVRNA
jgi:ketosteroid isomerase-like protein